MAYVHAHALSGQQWSVAHWALATAPGLFFALTNYLQNAAIAGGFLAPESALGYLLLFVFVYGLSALAIRAGWMLTAGRDVMPMVALHVVVMLASGIAFGPSAAFDGSRLGRIMKTAATSITTAKRANCAAPIASICSNRRCVIATTTHSMMALHFASAAACCRPRLRVASRRF